jgi:hypothetical protein
MRHMMTWPSTDTYHFLLLQDIECGIHVKVWRSSERRTDCNQLAALNMCVAMEKYELLMIILV